MAAPRAHANPAASEEPPRPRLVAPSPSSVVEKISTFCAFSMRCGQEKFASPFRSRGPRCRVRRSPGAAGTSRAAVFASSRAVAVDGAAGRRSPVLVGNARRAFTHRPPLRQGDAVRRLSAEADADRVASKRKGTNRILRPNLDEDYDNTDCVLRNDKTHHFRKRPLNHRHRLTAFSPASEEIIYAMHGCKYHAFRFVMRAAGLDPGIDPRTPKAPPGCLARGEAGHDEGRP